MPSLTFGSLAFLHLITRIPSSHSEEVLISQKVYKYHPVFVVSSITNNYHPPSVLSKPLLHYNRHAEASQPRTTDASPPVSLAAAPVYVGLELESELDDDDDDVVVTELGGEGEPAADDGVITGTAEEVVVSVATEKVV